MVRDDSIVVDDRFDIWMEREMDATPEHCLRERGSATRRGVWSIEFCRNAKKGIDVIDADDLDRKSTRLNSSHSGESRMPSSA